MAVPATDVAVDAAITRLQDALDVLKSAQKKDDAYYAKEDDSSKKRPSRTAGAPVTPLKGAEKQALAYKRAANRGGDQETSKSAEERARSKNDAQAGVPQPSDRLK